MFRIRRWLHEPLLHFLAIGAVLVVSTSAGRNPSSNKERIEIGPGEIESLVTIFQRTWQRPPTQQELAGESSKAGCARRCSIARR